MSQRTSTRFNLEALRNEKVAKTFQENMNDNLQSVHDDLDMNERWDAGKTQLLKTAYWG